MRMEPLAQRKHEPRRERKRRRNTSGPKTVQSQETGPQSREEKLINYVAVFLQVVLWLAFAWALSYLHMGAPCFLLAVLMWLYSEPLQALFSRAKKRAFNRGPKKGN